VPSPDVTDLIDLTLYDQTADDLVARALTDAAAKVPEWTPAAGNLEVILLEAISTVISELTYSVNRVPGAVLDSLLQLYGIFRSEGTYATATVTFTTASPGGITVPYGTVVQLALTGDTPLDFATDSEAVNPSGTLTTTVTALDLTSRANGTASGTPLELISSLPNVDTAALASPVLGGAAPESDSDWRQRAIVRLNRLVTTLVLPRHFTDEALESPGVYRAFAIDNYDGTATAAGHVTVAVLAEGGGTLTTGAKAALQADLSSKAQVNLAVHVIDPTITTVPVTAAIHPTSGSDPATVIAAVTAALTNYLNTDSWDWSGTVRTNELIAVISNVPGVDYVNSLTAPSGNVTLTGAANLAKLGTATITAV
jgi:uncharacterized phage protein gp47/JayE